MTDRDDEKLSPLLAGVVKAMRAVPEPSPGWRDRVLGAVEETSSLYVSNTVRFAAPRFWSIRPRYAVAAAIACVVIGGAIGTLSMWQKDEETRAISVAADHPPERVHFRFTAPSAARVSLAGDFNGWNPDAHPLRRSNDADTWELDVQLPPGRYAYAFVVDGKLARDPGAPQAAEDDFGTPHSILLVIGS
jgi:hypothetical protein